ncbi:MAG: hypothetical protein WD512_06745 [Candidatus Paceibacterota bacterium]
MSKENRISKDSIAEKFEFFFVGLIFTVLGLSIQTIDFSSASSIVIITELVSWFLFLISGLVGLNKLEWLPNIVYLRDKIQNRKKIMSELQAMSKVSSQILIAETQEYKNIHHIIDKGNNLSDKYNEAFQSLIKKHGIKNKIQRWTFYIGFVIIAFSRSFDHIKKIAF